MLLNPICDLASKNRPYDIFNPNGVISIVMINARELTWTKAGNKFLLQKR